MRTIASLVPALSRGLAVLAGLATFLVMLLITTDVTMRFLGSGVPGTLEIVTWYLMLVVAFLSIARVEQRDGMITVDALYDSFGVAGRRWVMAFATLVSAMVYGGLAFASLQEAIKQYEVGAYAITLTFVLLIWPAYFIVPVAFAAATLIAALRSLVAFMGDRVSADIRQSIGVSFRPAEQEVAAEIREGSF
ncbi:MAG: TRAP transporter small permease [Pseudomonadota bacterium]|nr:TRAP transporter small permease [Pseudomonadota bacterium]